MALIIIAEFAKNNPGDDIKILYNTGTILDSTALENLLASIFMGLFSSGGNDSTPREGTIPIGEKISFAFSVPSPDATRLGAIIVPTTEQGLLQKTLITNEFKDTLNPLKILLSNADVPPDKLELLVRRIKSKFEEFDDATRISNVFSDEI